MTATGYTQGVYAGPNTVRAMDYNGHEAIGVQISDAAPDGSCYLVTIDKHIQLSISPVIAASIQPYEPAEPPPEPECTAADLAATRKSLEEILTRMLSRSIANTGELRSCAVAMHELADVIDTQERIGGAQAAQAPGRALDGRSSADVPSAERSADAERSGKTCTTAGRAASLPDRDEAISPDYAEDVR